MAVDTWPKVLEVFMPLLDGIHPITSEELNELQDVLERLQDGLGYGISPIYGGTTNGPSGRNASVRERLDVFLDPDGSIADVELVTLEAAVGELDELLGAGLFVPFGKTKSSTDYRVIIQPFMTETAGGSGGSSTPSLMTPAQIWIRVKSTTGVSLSARTIDGYRIAQSSGEKVILQVLVFGPQSTV